MDRRVSSPSSSYLTQLCYLLVSMPFLSVGMMLYLPADNVSLPAEGLYRLSIKRPACLSRFLKRILTVRWSLWPYCFRSAGSTVWWGSGRAPFSPLWGVGGLMQALSPAIQPKLNRFIWGLLRNLRRSPQHNLKSGGLNTICWVPLSIPAPSWPEASWAVF